MHWSFATIVLVPRGQPFPPPSPAERRHVFAWAQAAGFRGVELADEWLNLEGCSEVTLRDVRTEVVDAGLRVSGLNVPRCLLMHESRANPDLSRLERALAAAGSLEAETLNFSLSLPALVHGAAARPPMRGSDAAPEEHRRAAELIDGFARRAHAAAVPLAVELHDDGLLDTAELCMQLLGRIRQPGVGTNPDVGNLCRGSGPLPDWERTLTQLAPHTTNWHVKNFRGGQPAPVASGDIDYAVAWKIMTSAGYDGWVSIESRFGDVLVEQCTALRFLESLASFVPTPLSR